jgi:hypothetical protein
LAAAAVVLAVTFGQAAPSEALTVHGGVGGMTGNQVYVAGNVPLLPAPTPSAFYVAGPIVVVNQTNVPTVETLNCAWGGGSPLEGYPLALTGNVAGPCNSASLSLNCAIIYNRVATILVLEGQCFSAATGTLNFAAVWEWLALPDAHTAAVGGYFVLG